METDPNTLTLVPMGSDRPIVYETTVDDIARLTLKYRDIDPTKDMEAARRARADLRGRRTAIEARRKEIKAEALEFGRKVDAAAKALTGGIEAIEEPIDTAIKAIEQAEARAKFLVDNAEKLAREEAERQAKAAEDARKKAEQDAEDARLAEVARLQGIEADRLAEEKARVEKAVRDAEKRQREAQKKLDDERAAFEAEKAATARKAKEEADARAKTEKEAEAAMLKALAELARTEQRAKPCAQCGKSIKTDKACGEEHASLQTDEEALAVAERETAYLRAVKAEALRPDKVKLSAFAGRVREAAEWAPAPVGAEAGEVIDRALADLEDIAKRLEAFGS